MKLTEKEKRYIRGEMYHFVFDQLDDLYSELQDSDTIPSAVDRIVFKMQPEKSSYMEKRLKIDRYANKCINKIFDEVDEILKSKKEFMELMLVEEK